MRLRELGLTLLLSMLWVQPILLLAQSGQTDYQISELRTFLADNKTGTISAAEMLTICNAYRQTEPELSNAFCVKAIASPFASENLKFKATALIDYGANLNKQGDFENAIQYLKEGLQIGVSQGDQEVQMHANNRLGIYYNDRGNNVLATDYYIKSLQLAEALKDTFGMIKPHVNLTGIFLDQNRTEKSIEYGLKGLELCRIVNDIRGESFLRNNLAVAYITQDRPEEAETHLLAALKISNERQEPERISRNHSNLCTVYRMMDVMPKAKYHCEKAEEVLSEISNPRSHMLHAVQYGWYFHAIEDNENAIKQAYKAFEIGDQAAIGMHRAGAYELLHAAYKNKGDFVKALEANEQYLKLKLGARNTEQNAEIATLEEDYLKVVNEHETIQSEMKMSLLEKESILSNSQRNIAILLSLLLGVIGFLFYYRSRLNQKTNDILIKKNSEIEKQSILIQESLGEKETLLKEIHHRVKNNLQIISSLLNLQSKKITDNTVLASINEGKNRVEAMSLIHQNLYQSDQLTSINMQHYFEQLLIHLSRSFEGSQKMISYRIEANDVAFDIDTAIPVGLMVNELVSNAFKHAFEDLPVGEIVVSLKPSEDDNFQLKVSDNGKGMVTDIDVQRSQSLGLRLVKSLGTRQLKGKMEIKNIEGAQVSITFRELKKVV